jgi:hypothetical protein
VREAEGAGRRESQRGSRLAGIERALGAVREAKGAGKRESRPGLAAGGRRVVFARGGTRESDCRAFTEVSQSIYFQKIQPDYTKGLLLYIIAISTVCTFGSFGFIDYFQWFLMVRGCFFAMF